MRIPRHLRPFIEDVDDRLRDLIREIEIRVRSIPCIKRLFSDTAVHHGATKSASDRCHGSPEAVHIRLDIGRRLRGVGIGIGIGDCLKVPAYVRPSSICRNIAPVADTFIAEAV